MTTPQEGVELIAAETERLKDYLETAPNSALQLDSPCEGWTVGDVIGHLGWAAEFFADAIAGGVAGVTEAPPGLPEPGSIPVPELSAYVAGRAIAYRTAADDLLLEAFTSSVDRLTSVLRSVEDADWDKMCYGLRAEQPLRNYVNTRISEVAVHSWDVRSPSGLSTGLSAECLPAILVRLPVWLDSLGLADFKPAQGPARYRFATSGQAEFQRDLTAGPEGGAMIDAPGEPDVAITCDAAALALAVWGRVKVTELLSDGRMSVSGDQAKAQEFTRWLSQE